MKRTAAFLETLPHRPLEELFCRSVSFSISFSYPKALKAKLIVMHDPATIGPSDKASEKWVKEVKK